MAEAKGVIVLSKISNIKMPLSCMKHLRCSETVFVLEAPVRCLTGTCGAMPDTRQALFQTIHSQTPSATSVFLLMQTYHHSPFSSTGTLQHASGTFSILSRRWAVRTTQQQHGLHGIGSHLTARCNVNGISTYLMTGCNIAGVQSSGFPA
jgi:hypothetical protein